MINQKWLSTFLKLAEVGHFTQTAEQLFMTQPGVSQHVQKLEQQLNVQLIQRFGKRFELTDAGIQLQQYGEQLLKQQEQLVSDIQLDSPYVGDCRFACSGSLAMWLFPHFIDYQILHPELSVSIEAAPNKRVIEQVINNDIDIGIVTQFVSNPELEVTAIGDDNLCLIVPAALKNEEINFDKLISLGVISHPDAMHYLQQLISSNYSDEQVGSIPIASYVNQLSQILLPVSKGLGFTVLPEFAVNSFEQQELISVVKLKHQVKEPLYMIRKKFRPLPKRYEWFIETTTGLINQ
ncbi:LysR family transcriptional regulator [Shewanella olleyana]|uniref:LysR family transcriptional regulator n=1 Tax=Shewanella olleyana TaxID=135626 RepID=UPI00200D3C0A|nr:LysR family transcriptional regulator [Shewanella olleyana]MCL1065441.1 LysR family transcriptional regulator [Shewanella olleyana]